MRSILVHILSTSLRVDYKSVPLFTNYSPFEVLCI